jgi:UDP-N-acetylmuramoylalanine--D-glutamate ligase
MHIKKQRKKLILDLLHNKKKNIVIWGFGITGKSILNWCLNNLSKEIHYIIIDKQNYELTIYESSYIKLVSESESETYFTLADVILPSPGIKIEKDTFFWYNKIIPELDLCSVLLDQKKIRSIIITGSIGKSSLTTIIKENIAQYKKSFLCGNIGFPILNFITKDLSGEEIFCIEASDAQLKHTVLVSPTVFLITNLFKNHLNFHKNFHHYIKAKLTPITFQISKIKKIIISDQAYNIIRHYIKTKKIEKKLIIAKTDNKKIITRKKIDYLHQKENSIFFNKKIILKDIPSVSFSSNWLMISCSVSLSKLHHQSSNPALSYNASMISPTQFLISFINYEISKIYLL